MSRLKQIPPPALAALLLGTALLAAYANSFHGPFIFDDEPSITNNPTLRSWKTVFFPPGDSGLTVSGRPLLNASFALNYALGGSAVAGYHTVNLLIHFLAALTFFGLLRRTFLLPSLREKFSASATSLALIVSAIWALHPLQTESVTYVVQRAESLVGLFFLLTLYCFVRTADTPSSAHRWQVLAVLSCLAGMASKEVMVSAPLIIFLFDRTFVSGSFAQAWRSHKKFHLMLAATWLLLAGCILASGGRGGTVGFTEDTSSWKYLLTQCHAITHYLRLCVWPHPLLHDHGVAVVQHLSEVWLEAVLVVGLLVATAVALIRFPRCGLLAGTFFALLAPTSSFVPVITQTVAEHRMYLPVGAVITLLALCIHRFWGHKKTLLFGTATALAFAILTHLRNHDYRSAETIWQDAAEKNPTSFRPWSALARDYSQQGRFEDAENASRAALELAPGNAVIAIEYAYALKENGKAVKALDVYRAVVDSLPSKPSKRPPDPCKTILGYGSMLHSVGRIDEAIAQFHTALRIEPDSSDAHFRLADALETSGRPAEAVTHYEAALRSDPSSVKICNNFGNVLIKLGRHEHALRVLAQGLAVDPANAGLRINQSLALQHTGRPTEARNVLQSVLAENPRLASAHNQLARLLESTGEIQAAIAHYRQAIANGGDNAPTYASLAALLLKNNQLVDAVAAYQAASSRSPGDGELLYRLGNVHLQSGDLEQAATNYQQAITVAPRHLDAHNELGIVYAQLGRLPEAAAQFEAALKIDPGHVRARENLARARGE